MGHRTHVVKWLSIGMLVTAPGCTVATEGLRSTGGAGGPIEWMVPGAVAGDVLQEARPLSGEVHSSGELLGGLGWYEPLPGPADVAVRFELGIHDIALSTLDADRDAKAMFLLHIEGELGTLEPEVDHTFPANRYGWVSNGLYVDGTGCSGTIEGPWLFDQPATAVTLRLVDAADGGTRVVLSATFDEGSAIEGSFILPQS